MSRYVDMFKWNEATSAVYADLLSDESRLNSAITAATTTFKGKRPGWYKRAISVQKEVSTTITKDISSPLAARLVDAGLKDVNWKSLTRRLIHQGKIDFLFYSSLAARYNGQPKSNGA